MLLRLALPAILALAACLTAQASDAITAPMSGASASVTQPHVVAELIPETGAVEPGKPFDVALHLHMDDHWHTYWINPGDAGLATTIKWTLPPGFTASDIHWPTPEKHAMGPLTTYGYGGDVYLLTTITPPKDNLPKHFEIKAKASWLVCQEECIPGRGEFTLPMDSGLLNLKLPVDNHDFFDQARARVPVENTRWDVKAAYGKGGGTVSSQHDALWIRFTNKSGVSTAPIGNVYFFPEQPNALAAKEDDNGLPESGRQLTAFELALTLQQNGDKPNSISGVLVSDQPLVGTSQSVRVSAVPTDSTGVPMLISRDGDILSASALNVYPDGSHASAVASAGSATADASAVRGDGHKPPLQQLTLLAALGAAFIGGLILNLMPCVLPVLSLKVFSLIKHADAKGAWLQGVAFTAGVVISFWLLAGALLALQSAGNHLGWGFQMQSPGFVSALIVLFFLIGLNLFGVFEFGTSLVGLDAKATSHTGGTLSSFLNGALATLAATPCTAPFMGSSLGFAAQQPPFVAMLIFTFLALGMATPYLLLTLFPAALRFVPKPGAWMESLKQFMGFLLLGTVIFLLYVFGALVGDDRVFEMLGVLLVFGLAAWVYGRWGGQVHSLTARVVSFVLVGVLVIGAAAGAARLAAEPGNPRVAAQQGADVDWQNWTPNAVDAALAQGKPVFVDFTAAWCLSCKVNERLALETDDVKNAFAQKRVALFRADWTHSDPTITKTLQDYQRDGVPLYLLYSPKDKKAQVLPEVLTPGIVLDALHGI